eukprot:TRINITY_DN4029_c0_g1_i1.p1 TRINITY_DN4029_c0_g1~~TRINITY_DN4029_c0_g1_i1.p1  ORF type:complete len:1235 (+),score=311.28 TRINITY_DN4029_c0_g1_i1:169-3705(+)
MSDNDRESDADEAPAKKPKRAAAPKKSKATPKKTSKKGKAAAAEAADEPDADFTMFDALLKGTAVAVQVQDWFERYQKDHAAGILELVNFIVKSCGCPNAVTQEQLDEDDVAKTVAELSDGFPEGDYPLVSKSEKSLKKFRSAFSEFWFRFARECPIAMLCDSSEVSLIGQVTNWLTVIASSKLRAFRHTGCVAGLQLVRSLALVAADVSKQLETAQRQIEIEKAKSGKRGSAIVRKVEQEADRLHERLSVIKNSVIDDLVKGIFMHRYRDSQASIRAESLTALGHWMYDFPSLFLQDSYSKYFGWMLNDEDSSVREAVLRALLKLYANGDFIAPLTFFTQRFQARFVQMCNDVDPAVASLALELCTRLYQLKFVEKEAVKALYKLLWDNNERVRAAAAAFVSENTFLALDSQSQSQSQSQKKKKQQEPVASDPQDQLRGIIALVGEHDSGAEDSVAAQFAVDAMWGTQLSALGDWQAYTALLSIDSKKAALKPDEQMIALFVLNAAVKKAAGKNITGGPEGKVSKTAKERILSDTEKLTTHFAVELPNLLKRFQGDARKVAVLAEMVQSFQLDVYHSARLQKNFKELLSGLHAEVFRLTETEPLNVIMTVLQVLTSTDHSLQKDAQAAVAKLGQKLHSEFQAAFGDSQAKADELLDTARVVCMRRCVAFARQLDLSTLKIFDDIANLLEMQQTMHAAFDDEVVAASLELFAIYLLTDVCKYEQDATLEEEVIRHREQLVDFVTYFLQPSGEADDDDENANAIQIVQHTAFISLATIMSALFGTNLELHPGNVALDNAIQYVDRALVSLIEPNPSTNDAALQLCQGLRALLYNASSKDIERYAPAVLGLLLHPNKVVAEGLKVWWKGLKEQSTTRASLVQCHTLRKVHERCSDDDYSLVHDLATRFSIAYIRPNAPKHEVLEIIRAGVEYVIDSDQDIASRLPFFEHALTPFVSKVSQKDAANALTTIREIMEKVEFDQSDPAWQSYIVFEDALDRVGAGKPATPAKPRTPVASRFDKKARKKLAMEEDIENSDDERENVPTPSRKRPAVEQEHEDIEEEEDEPDTQEFLKPAKKPAKKAASPKTKSTKAATTPKAATPNSATPKSKQRGRKAHRVFESDEESPAAAAPPADSQASSATKTSSKSNLVRKPRNKRAASPEQAPVASDWEQAPRRRKQK